MDECDSSWPAVNFTRLPAPAPLRDVVEGVWMLRADASAPAAADPVVPDGCVEIVFNLADPFVRQTERGAERQPLALLAGQMTTAVTVRPTGRVDLVGIRLRPDRASAWIGAPGSELRDRLIGIDAAPGVGRHARRLHDALGETTDTDERLAAIARLCGAWPRATATDREVAWALEAIRRTGGAAAISSVVNAGGLERRRLERGFRRTVGLTPKEFARITRVQRALALLDRQPRPTGAELAARCGYADQSHLIREFHALVGPTPGGAPAAGLGSLLRSLPLDSLPV